MKQQEHTTDRIVTLFKVLKEAVILIHIRWKLFRQLYGKNQARIDLMNATAGAFFSHLHYILFDNIILFIANITDPPQSVGKDNLTLSQLLKQIKNLNASQLYDRLQKILEKIEDMKTPFKEHRHKRIAHHDLTIRLNENDEVLPGISRQTIEDMLKEIRGFMNAVEYYFNFNEGSTGYEYVITQHDGDTLIGALKKATEYDVLIEDDLVTWSERLMNNKFKDA